MIKNAKYKIYFEHRQETMVEVFGNKPLQIGEMIKKLWEYIKKNNLGKSDILPQ